MTLPVCDDLKHKQLYLLEVLVKNVEITGHQPGINTEKSIIVKVKFLDFPYLVISRGDFLKNSDKNENGKIKSRSEIIDANVVETDAASSENQKLEEATNEEVNRASQEIRYSEDASAFNIGKSCMFPMLPLDLMKQIQRYPLIIQVFQRNSDNEYDMIGGAKVRLGPDFEDLILDAGQDDTQLPVSNILESDLPIKSIFGEPVGRITLFIRLSCYGVTIVNQFQLIGEGGEYMFKNDKMDNTLQAQRKRSFIFGQEPYTTASILGKLIHPNDTRNLKPIITTEENILLIKDANRISGEKIFEHPSLTLAPGRSFGSKIGNDSESRGFSKYDDYAYKPTVWQSNIVNENFDEMCPSDCTCYGTDQNILSDEVLDSATYDKFAIIMKTLIKETGAAAEKSPRDRTNVVPMLRKSSCCDGCCGGKMQKNYEVNKDLVHTSKSNATPNRYSGAKLSSSLKPNWNKFINSKMEQKGIDKNSPVGSSNKKMIQGAVCDCIPAKDEGDQCFFADRPMHEGFLAPEQVPLGGNGKCSPYDCNNVTKDASSPKTSTKVDSDQTRSSMTDQKGGQLRDEKTVPEPKSERRESFLDTKQQDVNVLESKFPTDKVEGQMVGEAFNIDNVRAVQKKTSNEELETIGKKEYLQKNSTQPRRKQKARKARKAKSNKSEETVTSVSKKMRRRYLSIYKYTGGMYPGINVGHRQCADLYRFVPKSMGWLWNLADIGDGLKPRRGWKPGAINKTIANMIRQTKLAAGIKVEVEEEKPKAKPKTGRGKGRRPISAGSSTASTIGTRNDDDYDAGPLPPTLHVHKKDGVYFISMNPLRLEDDDEEQVPLMFKIDAEPSTSSSESSLEIECTAPGALRRRQMKPPPVCQDQQTNTEEMAAEKVQL